MSSKHLAFAILIAASGEILAQQSQCTAATSAVLAAEKSIAAAQVANDLTAIEKLLAPGYTFTIPDGKIVSRAQFLEDMRKWWRPLAVQNTEQSVRCSGEVVTVIGRALYRWKGKDAEEMAREQYTDTYAKIDGTWQRVSSHSSCLEGRCS